MFARGRQAGTEACGEVTTHALSTSHFLPYQDCGCGLRLLFLPPPLFRQACGGPNTRIPIGLHHDLSNHSQRPLVDSTSKSSVGEGRLPNEIHIHPELTLGCLRTVHVVDLSLALSQR